MREMKDSGIEWIGKIPYLWNITRYKFFSQSRMGETILGEDIVESGIPVYSATNDEKLFGFVKSAKVILHRGDLIIPARGNSIGYMKYVDYDEATCTQTTICSYNIHGIERRFLFYCSYAFKDDWYKYDGSAIPQVTVEQLKNNYLPLPSIEEQKSIADYLDSKCSKIDEITAKQKQIVEKLKEYKASIISEAVTKGLNSDVEMKDSGYKWIGMIPKHWKMVYAKQLFLQRKDRAYDEDEQLTSSQKYGIISQQAFMELEGRQVMQVLKGEEILKHVEKGDFVISMRSFQGGLEYSEVSGKISSAYVMIIPNREKVYDRYYKWLFKSSQYITALQGTSNLIRDGQALRFSNFAQVYLPSFSLKEQEDIADYLDKICPMIDKEIQKREMLLVKLDEYKKSVVYEVVTGKKTNY